MYSVYMGEFKIAMKTLASYESESAQFREILSLLQQSPLCERLSLTSYLLTPIQRLPRYELLLKVGGRGMEGGKPCSVAIIFIKIIFRFSRSF